MQKSPFLFVKQQKYKNGPGLSTAKKLTQALLYLLDFAVFLDTEKILY